METFTIYINGEIAGSFYKYWPFKEAVNALIEKHPLGAKIQTNERQTNTLLHSLGLN